MERTAITPGREANAPRGKDPRRIYLRQCKLAVLKGEERGKELVVAADVIRIGKARENDLVLPEETVSRMHCEILRDTRGYLLRDLGSTNGTFLDGAEIREAYIRGGSVITAGTVQISFQPFEEQIEVQPTSGDTFGELVGGSLRMREIFGVLDRIAQTDATVLLVGEQGTGKDLAARTVHRRSRRGDGPFIVVDCGGSPGTRVEGELFGFERGALPGVEGGRSSGARQGAFEQASGGTLFLDDVGELALDQQQKLLKVIEQRELRRVGGSRTIKIDARVIAASRRDLLREVERGKFREDLYFRLSVVPIVLPPLRERREDVPLLVRELLRRVGGIEEPSAADAPSPQVLALLAEHTWPGNVRELRELLERLGPVLSRSGVRHKDGEAAAADVEPVFDFDSGASFRGNKERWNDVFERRYLKWLTGRADGNISRAAREADMDRKHLHKLLKKHGAAE